SAPAPTTRLRRKPDPAPPVSVRTSATRGAILGTVKDDHGKPIGNVVVSAVGGTTSNAVTDKDGQFGFGPLPPGPYLLRAHLAGYLAPHGTTIKVDAGAQATSAIT